MSRAEYKSGKERRPRKPINPEALLRFLQIYPTKEQTANFFDCSPDHIENEIERLFECTFSALRERQSQGMKRALMSWCFKYAKRGNHELIKFAMKNINGWTDKPEVEQNTNQVIELRYSINKKNGPRENVDNDQKQLAAGDAGGEATKGE